MSVNQISQDYLCWSTPHHHQQQQQLLDSPISKSLQNFNLNHPNDEDEEVINIDHNPQQSEVMFEKPLTPSDVGKLNRLVIPKQHAERHFPLNGADSGGLLLSFEDEVGKLWRFRYSYWNSSQSYVLTKGWSRYVKEKSLDAGDVVIFERHPTDSDRLFIGWRRRHDPAQMDATAVGGRGVVNQASFNGSTSSRTLRLFGVNMEYQFESDHSEPATPDGSSTSSPSGHHQQEVAAYYGMSNHMVQQYARRSQHRG